MLVAATLMPAKSDHRFAAGAIAGVAVYCVATVIFAWVSYTQYEQDFRVEVEGRLTAIAELKAKEVAAWYRERSADARYFVDNESVLALIRQFDAGPPPVETVHALEDTFRRMQENHGYEWIGYYDAAGVRLITVPAAAPEDRHMVEEVLRVAAHGEVAFLDSIVTMTAFRTLPSSRRCIRRERHDAGLAVRSCCASTRNAR